MKKSLRLENKNQSWSLDNLKQINRIIVVQVFAFIRVRL